MKLFKIYIIILCIFLIISPYCLADDIVEEDFENLDLQEVSANPNNDPVTHSKHIVVIDRKTHSVLYEKDAYSQTAMASTTKIMTCILALENLNLNKTVTISKNSASIHGSTLGLHTNDKITVTDLLYGLMLRSGNDCAIQIAEETSGTLENFANLMNEKSRSLNLKNTNFVTPNGLDNENHFTSAYDLAILTDYALKNETFKKIVSTKNYTITINGIPRNISNTNELLGNLEGVYGVKTGFTFNAGRCLVSSCKRGEMDIIVVVLGADTKTIRTKDSYTLINYIFKNFSYVDVSSILENSFNNYINNNSNFILEKSTTAPEFELEKISNYKFPLKLEEIVKLNTKIHIMNKFSSETQKGASVGTLYLYNDNKLLCSTNIILKNNLVSNSWNHYFKNIFENLF